MRPKRGEVAASSSSTSAEASAHSTPSRSPPGTQIHLQRRIGSGTFGTVYQAKMHEEDVAVKKVVLDPQYVNRELEIMQMVTAKPHSNIIKLKHSNFEESGICFLVMERYTCALDDQIQEWARAGRTIGSCWKTKVYAYQVARGLAHIHGLNICHRDLKPQNILVRPATGELVLCDFGSAKVLGAGKNCPYIASRFYRAPECILENEQYTTAIDIWAFGCADARFMPGMRAFVHVHARSCASIHMSGAMGTLVLVQKCPYACLCTRAGVSWLRWWG